MHSSLRALLVAAALALLAPAAAEAAPDPGCLASHEDPGLQQLAATGYAQDFGVSYAEAYRRLEVQDRVVEVSGRITASLGPRYAGAWFDNADGGRFKVGYTAGADLEPARRIVAECRLEASVVFLQLEWSWTELLAAQDGLTARLKPLRLGERWSSGLAVSRQRWVIRVEVAVLGLAAEDSAAIDAALAATPVPVERVNVENLDLGHRAGHRHVAADAAGAPRCAGAGGARQRVRLRAAPAGRAPAPRDRRAGAPPGRRTGF